MTGWARPKWKDPQWLNLLHYKETWSGNYESQVDGGKFFLSKNGKYSPKDELEALIESLAKAELNSQCRFPARMRWLKQQGHVFEQSSSCAELDEFRKQVAARSISVVFSSYFLSNPVSSFGHTFLRLGKDEAGAQGDELLDTGLNFSAQTSDEGMIEYMIKGLTGGFSGEFLAVPYYDKVHEYNDSELRDLWTYDLDLTQNEIDFIVDHIWELRNTPFDYFFLSENCSYHVLTLLEVARPSLKLSDRMPSYVIPVDTLKAMERANLLKNVSFRPSPERIYHQRSRALSSSERDALDRFVDDPKLVKLYQPARAAAILDAALAKTELREKNKETLERQRALLLARAQIPVRSSRENYDHILPSAPHLGHDSKRFSVGQLNRTDKTWMTLGLRMAQHDVLDNETSYLPRSGLELLDVVGRSDGKKFEVDQFYLLQALNLRDITELKSPLAWKVRVGGWRDVYGHEEMKEYGAAGGVGIAKALGPVSLYALSHLETVYTDYPVDRVKPGLGADLGLLVSFAPGAKWHTMYALRDYRWNESSLQNELRLTGRNFGVGFQSTYYVQSRHSDLVLNTFTYF